MTEYCRGAAVSADNKASLMHAFGTLWTVLDRDGEVMPPASGPSRYAPPAVNNTGSRASASSSALSPPRCLILTVCLNTNSVAYCSRLRLAAATSLLELAASKNFDGAITDAVFFRLAITMQVRAGAEPRLAIARPLT